MPKISNSYESERKRILARTSLKLERMVNTLLEKHLEEQGVTENNTEEEIRTKCTPEVLQPFLEDVAEITGCMNSTIWIYKEDGKKLWIKAATGLAKELLDRDNVFYEISEEAVTPEIWRTGEIKCAYNKEQLSKYQGERGRGKFDDIWKGAVFEVFYGFLLKAFGKRIGVIKIENPPGQGRLSLEKEKEELIKKAHEFNLILTKEQIDRLKRVGFNTDIDFLEEYFIRLPYYKDFMNYLEYRIKTCSRDIEGIEPIEARIKAFPSVIEKIYRRDKLDKGETKYKKGYFFICLWI